MKDVGSLVVGKRQSRKIFVVKYSINAVKVHRTGILKLLNIYIPVLCTSCANCNLYATNINGALHLKRVCFVFVTGPLLSVKI